MEVDRRGTGKAKVERGGGSVSRRQTCFGAKPEIDDTFKLTSCVVLAFKGPPSHQIPNHTGTIATKVERNQVKATNLIDR